MNCIVILEPSSSALELIKTAKVMGLKNLILTANCDERIIPDKYKNHIDDLIICDTYNRESLKDILLNYIKTQEIRAIIPGSEYHVPLASHLSQVCSLPGVNPKYVENLRIKDLMRNFLQESGIRIPHYKVINSKKQLLDLGETIKFPCVLKPVASAGSIHVTRANSFTELQKAYAALLTDSWSELGKSIGNSALVEEYIEGEEFSIEGYIADSRAQIISITKKFLSNEPYFIEMGHIVSANISEELKEKIGKYIFEVIKALRINLGIFHAELRVDKNGPVLMEIAGRLPGCRIPDLIQLATGINFYQVMIDCHLGNPIQLNSMEKKQYAGMCYFELNDRNNFKEVNGLEELQNLPGFQEFKLLKNPGEYVPPLTSFLGRVAYCIFTASAYKELEETLEFARKIISFK